MVEDKINGTQLLIYNRFRYYKINNGFTNVSDLSSRCHYSERIRNYNILYLNKFKYL